METRFQKRRRVLNATHNQKNAALVETFHYDETNSSSSSDAVGSSNIEVTSLVLPSVVKRQSSKKLLRVTVKDIEDAANEPQPLPPNFYDVWQGILDMRVARDAPVDHMGCDKLADVSSDVRIQRFHHLVAVFLSSQTADKATAACMERLKSYGLTVESVASSSIEIVLFTYPVTETLEAILRGVSFHKTKAKNLIRLASILRERYNSDIPDSYDGLCALPGIGPKMALIALNSAWGRVEGIAVDVHVHRITNRLNWIHTKTPEESCLALARVIPRPLWEEFNNVLVGFGQQRCKALHPLVSLMEPVFDLTHHLLCTSMLQCDSCLVRNHCPSAQLTRKKPIKLRQLKDE